MAKPHVLIIRPEPHNQRTQSFLRQKGWQVSGQAIMAITPCLELTPLALEQQLIEQDLLISVSPRATAITNQALADRSWPSQINYAAVGPASASEWQRLGLEVRTPAQTDSEGLLDLLNQQGLTQGKVLILSGHDGRTWLTEQLQRCGADVAHLYCYRRTSLPVTPEQLDTWISEGVNVVACHSVSLLELLHQQCLLPHRQDWLQQCELLLPSQRACQQAEALGYTNSWNCHGGSDTLVHCTLSKLANRPKESQ